MFAATMSDEPNKTKMCCDGAKEPTLEGHWAQQPATRSSFSLSSSGSTARGQPNLFQARHFTCEAAIAPLLVSVDGQRQNLSATVFRLVAMHALLYVFEAAV